MISFLLLTTMTLSTAHADEGMWPLNAFPTKQVESLYHFKADESWLSHVRLSAARLAGGCSGSFVSAQGLVMTNHHCAQSCIEQLSKDSRDYIATGFFAKKPEDEVRCPEMEVDRLVEMTDVTAQIQKATAGLEGKPYNDKLKAQMAEIEKDCAKGSDRVRCDVVNLYHGGLYHLYRYERYQDVRLVFAPEFAAAFFGGDPDNFNFPRYDFDISFVRVYDQGKPLDNKEFFRWSKDGAVDSELTFVVGHPGHTSRLLAVSELEYLRDVRMPRDLLSMSELRGLLTEFQTLGSEQRRISQPRLFGVENRLKATKGKFQTLTNKKFFAQKVKAENEFLAKVNAKPKLKKLYGSAWTDIAQAEEELKKISVELEYIENNSFGSKLYGFAKTLVRAGDELPKPNPERLREYVDSALPQLKQGLMTTAPIYDELEILLLTHALTKTRENLTADHPFVKKILGASSPRELAEKLIKGTKLKDGKLREQLFNDGKVAVAASKDPLVEFARLIDQDARPLRTKFEDEIETKIKKNSERVAQAQFAIYGTKNYPDATFTLRASIGQVLGYEENGHEVQPITHLKGAFERHTGREPFNLPESWLKNKDKLNLETPLNFATTNDIIGGNSGSPVINQSAEVVGLIFDGNIQSLGGDFGYDPADNRAVSVHSSAILEVLRKIYGADRIVSELQITP